MEKSDNTINVLGASPYNSQAITFANTFPGNNISMGTIANAFEINEDIKQAKFPPYMNGPGIIAYDAYGNPYVYPIPTGFVEYLPNEDGTWPKPEDATPEQTVIHHYDNLVPVFHPKLSETNLITWVEVKTCSEELPKDL